LASRRNWKLSAMAWAFAVSVPILSSRLETIFDRIYSWARRRYTNRV
jgi:hypothetical protein